jgi:hypothetical protein
LYNIVPSKTNMKLCTSQFTRRTDLFTRRTVNCFHSRKKVEKLNRHKNSLRVMHVFGALMAMVV